MLHQIEVVGLSSDWQNLAQLNLILSLKLKFMFLVKMKVEDILHSSKIIVHNFTSELLTLQDQLAFQKV